MDNQLFQVVSPETEAPKGTYRNRTTEFKVLFYKKKELKALYPAGGYAVRGQIGGGRDRVGTLLTTDVAGAADEVPSASNTAEPVYAVSKMPHAVVTGYVPVGADEYIAVVKDVLALWILFAALALLLLALCGFLIHSAVTGEPEPTPAPAPGSIDTNAQLGEGELSVPAKTETKGKQIKVNGIATMNLKAGQIEQNFVFSNPEENPCYFKIEIALQDTGEVIYTSGLLPPGYSISKFNLNRALDAGTYPIVVHFNAFSFDTEQRPLNNMDVKTTIVAS